MKVGLAGTVHGECGMGVMGTCTGDGVETVIGVYTYAATGVAMCGDGKSWRIVVGMLCCMGVDQCRDELAGCGILIRAG